MSLRIQNFLRDNTPETLTEKYAIKVSPSVKYPNLHLFKYDQINSPMAEPIVQECRGLILDRDNNWVVVARPFDKFFNYGEQLAHPIDWESVKVQEKIDGSLMTVYFYNNKWNVASSGNPDAAGQVNAWPISFHDLFWKTWADLNLDITVLGDRYTYMFELTTPYNMVVVPHSKSMLTLIGVRNIDNNKESDPRQFRSFFPVPQQFALTSFDDVVASFDNVSGHRFEGYVLVDKDFKRVKVKHPQYVALHHMKDSIGASPKRLVEIIRKNESEEFLAYFPEFAEQFHIFKAKYHKLVDGLDMEYGMIRATAKDRKEFAGWALKSRLPGFLFTKLDGKTKDAKHYVADMQIDKLMQILEAM
jgi:T4 RnlA family RNA ligase